MSDEPSKPPIRPVTQGARQGTVDALCEHFANDVLEIDEFERRVDLANRVESADELKSLLADLPTSGALVPHEGAPLPMASTGQGVAPAERVRDKQWIVAVMGGFERKGRWVPARKSLVTAVMGGGELDFREAMLGPGITEITVLAVMGGVEITVPPGMQVESSGIAIMGGFGHSEQTNFDPSAPVLRIKGFCVMGGVDIRVRYPGETGREAKRRLRQERRQERKRLKGG